MSENDSSFWNDKDSTTHGWVHKANRTGTNFVPGVAVIFVHGILSSPALWDSIGNSYLTKAMIDVDCFAFGYECFPGIDISNAVAADNLESAVTQVFIGDGASSPKCGDGTGRFLFIVHSNGGVLVKNLLLKSTDIRARTIGVFNIAVPHAGGRFGLSVVSYFVTVVNLLIYPILLPMGACLRNLLGIFGIPFVKLGMNWIFWEISWPGRQLMKLEQSYKTISKIDCAHIRVVDVIADADVAANSARAADDQHEHQHLLALKGSGFNCDTTKTHEKRDFLLIQSDLRSSIRLRGLHFLDMIDRPRLTEYVRVFLKNGASDAALVFLMQSVVKLIDRSEKQRRVKTLVKGTPERPQQADLYERILADVSSITPDTRILLYGVSGVGKTRLLARLCRDLLNAYVEGLLTRGAHDRIPLLVQLQFLHIANWKLDLLMEIRATENEVFRRRRIRKLLLAIVSSWWQNLETEVGNIPISLRRNVIRVSSDQNAVLLIDGAEELLRKYPQLYWQDIYDVIKVVARKTKAAIVVAFREGFVGIRDLKLDHWTALEIFPLDRLRANDLYPGIGQVFQKVERDQFGRYQEVLNLLGSPLVLTVLERQIGNLLSQRTLRVTDLLDIALRQILRGDQKEALDDEDVRVDAIMLVARVLYQLPDASNAVAPHSVLVSGVRLLYDQKWSTHLSFDSTLKMAFDLVAPLGSNSDKIGYENKANPFLQSLMSTIFTDSGSDGTGKRLWGLQHRYWSDFLVGRYFARCCKIGVVEDLGDLGYLPDMNILAGEIAGSWNVPSELVRKAKMETLRKDNIFYICNLVALYAWDPLAEVEGIALGEFCDSMIENIAPVARCFVMNAICDREIRKPLERRNPLTWSKIIQTLKTILKQRHDRLSASQAWCYLMLLSPDSFMQEDDAFDISTSTADRKQAEGGQHNNDLNGDIAAVSENVTTASVENLVATWEEITFEPNNERWCQEVLSLGTRQNQSVQASFAQLVSLIPKTYDYRGIPLVHYLYFLVHVALNGKWIDETKTTLLKVFDRDSAQRTLLNQMNVDTSEQKALKKVLCMIFDKCGDEFKKSCGQLLADSSRHI